MTYDHDEQIRQRAHELWGRDGRPEGRHEEHWQRAREEIEAEAGLSETDVAQMASLRGSSPDPGQARSRRSRAPSDAPATKTTRGSLAQNSARPEPSSQAVNRGAKLQGNLPSKVGGTRGKEQDTRPAPKHRHPENPDLT